MKTLAKFIAFLIFSILATAAFLCWTRIDQIFGAVFGRVAKVMLWATSWRKVDLCRFLFMAGLGLDTVATFWKHGPTFGVAMAIFNFIIYRSVHGLLVDLEPVIEDGSARQPDGSVKMQHAIAMGIFVVYRCFLVGTILFNGSEAMLESLLIIVGCYALSGSYPGKTAKAQLKERRAARDSAAAYTKVYAVETDT